MLNQLAYGAVLIGVTVLIHAVCLEGIITAWRAVSIELAYPVITHTYNI